MFHKKSWLVVSLLIVVAMVLAACQPAATPIVQTVVVEQEGETIIVTATPDASAETSAAPAEKKVLRMSSGASDLPTIDTAMATDVNNIQVIEEMTVGLVRQNVQTAELEPGMATSWEISDDGLVYTFTLRDDVPWVKYDAATDQVVNVQDCEGNNRMVTADDFAYGIMRTLNPATASDYAYVLTPVIAGAAEYNSGEVEDPTTVGVKAIDATTLEISFLAPAVYNLNIAGLWVAHAQPSWLIEGDDCTQAQGDKWTETGFYQGYGPFTLKEWIHDAYITLAKNPLWPGTDSVPVPMLDELTWVVLDSSPTLAEFESGNLEQATVPNSDYDRIMSDPDLLQQVIYTSTLGTEFYAFTPGVEPTGDVRVRKALSMAIDRESLLTNVVKSGKVADYFTNPGVAGAPKPEAYPDLGIKYDPEGAKALLQEYLDEKGITADQITLSLMYNTDESRKKIAETVAGMWGDVLGVNTTILNQERKVFLQTRRAGTENIYRGSWVQDYPDANNFLSDVFGPGGGYADVVDWEGPSYDEFVNLIQQAAMEADPEARMDLYAQAEQILVTDEAIIAPLYWYNTPVLVKPYVTHFDSITGYDRYEFWDITQ
ncbi:MAG: peptide ABC transporter substrate-binding protein [Chloroflexi bacterium]|nr:peptide ABC transporter substrate-binding protein [Chloroflexota bacterium]